MPQGGLGQTTGSSSQGKANKVAITDPAEGLSVERDYVEAYRWYGMAFLAGEASVRPNMDIVWQQLQRHDLEGALALTREFDALAAGEVPAGLAPPPAEPASSTPAAEAPDTAR